ncbi:MAG: hypothetical protein V4685_14615 [Bacteroidota bacterium]
MNETFTLLNQEDNLADISRQETVKLLWQQGVLSPKAGNNYLSHQGNNNSDSSNNGQNQGDGIFSLTFAFG